MNPQQQAEAAKASRRRILAAGLSVAMRVGVLSMTRREVAAVARVAPALISHYYGDMTAFRAEVMAEAVRQRNLPMIREGIAAHISTALAAPPDIRQAALMS